MMNTLKLYYQHKTNNFGDALNYNIFSDLFSCNIKTVRPYQADAIGIGSILNRIFYEPGISIISRKNINRKIGSIINKKPINILGSGFINDISDYYPDLKLFRPINLVGIRGRKSLDIIRKNVGNICDDFFIGDPGLLISDFKIKSINKRFDIGIIPHEVDKNMKHLSSISKKKNICILNPNDPTIKFIENVLSCETIASSSLHGLIAADSFHIPNLWIKLSNRIIGNDFKYHDYYSSYGLEQSFVDLTQNNLNLISKNFITDKYKIDSDLIEKNKQSIKNHLNQFFQK